MDIKPKTDHVTHRCSKFALTHPLRACNCIRQVLLCPPPTPSPSNSQSHSAHSTYVKCVNERTVTRQAAPGVPIRWSLGQLMPVRVISPTSAPQPPLLNTHTRGSTACSAMFQCDDCQWAAGTSSQQLLLAQPLRPVTRGINGIAG